MIPTVTAYNEGTETSDPGAAPTAPGPVRTCLGGPDMAHATCSIDRCGLPVHARGWCGSHYQRWRRYGDPHAGPHASDVRRFLAGVRLDPTGCFTRTRGVGGNGYSRFSVNNVPVMAHRWAYERWVGPIPEGLQIDHLCRNRACVNPAHLEAVTPRENSIRGTSPPAVNATKGQCVNGHPFDAANTYTRPNGNRACRVCRADAQRRYLQNRSAA